MWPCGFLPIFSLGSSWLVHWFIFSVSTAIFGIYYHVWKYGKTDGLKILLFDLEALKNAVMIRVLDRSDRIKIKLTEYIRVEENFPLEFHIQNLVYRKIFWKLMMDASNIFSGTIGRTALLHIFKKMLKVVPGLFLHGTFSNFPI